MRVIVATKNPGKIREISEILSEFDIEVVSQADAGIDVEVDETGSTFLENALIKARAVSLLCDDPVLADDSGLCVEKLDGRPGVHTARYGGNISNKEKMEKLLEELSGETNRNAKFMCSVALVFPDGRELTAEGETAGKIADEISGDGGFGFDPVFYSNELKKKFSECMEEEKNKISHRGKALTALRDKLGEVLKKED